MRKKAKVNLGPILAANAKNHNVSNSTATASRKEKNASTVDVQIAAIVHPVVPQE